MSDFKGNLVKKNNFRPTGATIDQVIKSILTLVIIFKVEGET
ncbi:unnamed protein product [marine sediment metagenome]|uniref:Uncharacterized protein n=1 Tax=marine sediment metagenome TaxID=412755 RepID=X1E4K5_9ZZZZ